MAGRRADRSASAEWVADENGMISVILNGTLYAREADSTCGRLEIRYKDADGDVLETRQGRSTAWRTTT